VPCPQRSSATDAAASKLCRCDAGYYRAARDKPSVPCTRKYAPYHLLTPVLLIGDRKITVGGPSFTCIGLSPKQSRDDTVQNVFPALES